MNDHDAMTAVNTALDAYIKGTDPVETIHEIARISGRNQWDHQQAKAPM